MEWLGLCFLLVWVILILLGLPGLIAITQLRLPSAQEMSASDSEAWPTVSIVVAACNEERSIAAGLGSLLALDYPDVEIIAINDRSTDRTGAIIRELACREPRLRCLDIDALPAGWLGKNHALHQGAKAAHGEWLLFTDADVVFHPLALKLAIRHAKTAKLDHLALAPKMKAKGLLLQSLVFLFMFNLMLFFRPQYAKYAWSTAHMGVGAFNLIKKQVYEAIGTHEVIRMRPDDDLKLGHRVKQMGFRQDFAIADSLLAVEWYSSIGEMVRGLEKNTMAPFEYRVPLLLVGLIPLTMFYLLPFVGPFLTGGWGRTVYLAMLVIVFLYFSLHERFAPISIVHFLLFPLSVPLLIFALARAALLTWLRKGIVWRGTLYPLHALRSSEGAKSNKK